MLIPEMDIHNKPTREYENGIHYRDYYNDY